MMALPGEAPSARRFTKAQNLPRNTHRGERKKKNLCFLSGTNQIYLHAPAPLSGNNKQANTKQIVANYV